MEQLRQGATVSMALSPTLSHVCPSALQPQSNYMMMIWSLCRESNFSRRQVASWRLLADSEGTAPQSACDQLLHQADYSKLSPAQYRMWTVMLMRAGNHRGLTSLQDVDRRNFAASCFTYIYVLGSGIFKTPSYKTKCRGSVFYKATCWNVRWWNRSGGTRIPRPIQSTQLALKGFWVSLSRGLSGVHHQLPSSADVKGGIELYL